MQITNHNYYVFLPFQKTYPIVAQNKGKNLYMCGIFGIVIGKDSGLQTHQIETLLSHMLVISEARGKEAAGLAIALHQKIHSFKSPLRARKMVKNVAYKRFISSMLTQALPNTPLAAIGHARLVTNGAQAITGNNQPVISDHTIGVHNGIIVNVDDLWRKHTRLNRLYEVDTEILFRMIDSHEEQHGDIKSAISTAYGEINGIANIAFFHERHKSLCLASNNGSLYLTKSNHHPVAIVASEKYLLQEMLTATGVPTNDFTITQIEPSTGALVCLETLAIDTFTLKERTLPAPQTITPSVWGKIVQKQDAITALRRCTKCLLPHTFPFISFNEQGVCNKCENHAPPRHEGREALREIAARYKKTDGTPDCLVMFSGGRDSSYALHYLKTEMNLNPVAFTYDWGMLTDLGRRNQSRICSKLGVEHIIRAADIPAKRRYIRKNIEAWCKRPQLGTIPLLMAGDKHYYHEGRKAAQEMGINLGFMAAGSEFEKTEFKSGFCGIHENTHEQVLANHSALNKVKMFLYYGKEFLLNPSYLNASLWDSWTGFSSALLHPDRFEYFFHYIPWNEKEISETLSREYAWETAEDTENTWRIGDGTAVFYNYIYYTVAGFSEYDTFRSHQIRAGHITRDEGLRLLEKDNLPRFPSMRHYAETIGFSLDDVLSVIHTIDPLYGNTC